MYHRRPLLLALTGLMLLSHLTAEEAAAAPQIFSEAPSFDFGSKPNSEKVIHTFVLENKGDSLLTIHNVKPTCGCTIANISTQELQPGDKAEIKTSLDLRMRSGKQVKHITVNSNDPKTPAYTLTLTGTAIPNIEINPRTLNFGMVPETDIPPRVITFKSNTGEPFNIESVLPANKKVTTEVVTVTEGTEYQIKVTPIPQEGTGNFNDVLNIRTNLKNEGVQRVMVMWQVQPPVMVAPTQVSLVANGEDRPITRYLIVRATQEMDPDMVVTGAEWPGRDNIRLTPTNTGKYGWRIAIEGIVPVREMNNETIRIYTNVSGFETNEVPVKIISQ